MCMYMCTYVYACMYEVNMYICVYMYVCMYEASICTLNMYVRMYETSMHMLKNTSKKLV